MSSVVPFRYYKSSSAHAHSRGFSSADAAKQMSIKFTFHEYNIATVSYREQVWESEALGDRYPDAFENVGQRGIIMWQRNGALFGERKEFIIARVLLQITTRNILNIYRTAVIFSSSS